MVLDPNHERDGDEGPTGEAEDEVVEESGALLSSLSGVLVELLRPVRRQGALNAAHAQRHQVQPGEQHCRLGAVDLRAWPAGGRRRIALRRL